MGAARGLLHVLHLRIAWEHRLRDGQYFGDLGVSGLILLRDLLGAVVARARLDPPALRHREALAAADRGHANRLHARDVVHVGMTVTEILGVWVYSRVHIVDEAR